MAKEFNNSPRTYLRVNKDGLLYIGLTAQQKTLTEPEKLALGFSRVELKDGKHTYHKTFGSTDDGLLSYIGINEKEFGGSKVKLLELAIEGESGVDQITFNLFKQNGNMDDYAKNLATLLPNLDFSEKINIVPSRKKNDRGYAQRNVFINYPNKEGDANFVTFAHKYGKDGDIPMADPTTAVDGSIKYDFTKQDTYLFNILNTQIERFKAFKGVNSTPNDTTQPETASQPQQSAPDLQAENHDDLPF